MPKERLSAAALLFDVSPADITIRIPQPLVGFTIAQLHLPKGSVTVVERKSAQGKKLEATPQLKLSLDDELILRGRPHALATIAYMTGGHLALLKPKEAAAMKASLTAEKEALALAAQELYDRLLPLVRQRQLYWENQRRLQSMAAVIQGWFRGKHTRRVMRVHLERIARRRVRVRLVMRRAAADVIRRRYEKPVLHKALLRQLAAPLDPVAALQAMQDVTEDQGSSTSLAAVLAARRVKIARSYETTCNKMISAARENEAIGAPLPLITLLLTDEVSLSATVTINEMTIKAMALPADLLVTRMHVQ